MPRCPNAVLLPTMAQLAVSQTLPAAADPFHTRKGEPMQRLFSADGSLTAPPGDPLWGVSAALAA